MTVTLLRNDGHATGNIPLSAGLASVTLRHKLRSRIGHVGSFRRSRCGYLRSRCAGMDGHDSLKSETVPSKKHFFGSNQYRSETMTIEAIVTVIIIISEMYILAKTVPNLVRAARSWWTTKLLAEVRTPSPAERSLHEFYMQNQAILRPESTPSVAQVEDFERPKWATPPPAETVVMPQESTPIPQPSRPTTNQPAAPIGNVHIPASCDNYYEVLAVLPDSNELEIKSAYRSLVKIWHPDTSKFQDAQASMAAILEAYECLSQPDERKLYDEGLRIQGGL